MTAIPTIDTQNLRLRSSEVRNFDTYSAFRQSARAEYVGRACTRAQAFDKLGWDTGVSCVTPGNTHSIVLAERMGATREADFTTIDGMQLHVFRHPAPEALT